MGDCYRVRAVTYQRNMNGVPDFSPESVDDHFLQGQHPAISVLFSLPEMLKVRLDAEDSTGVLHPDQERAAV